MLKLTYLIFIFYHKKKRFHLVVRQQPSKARLCSFKEKGKIKALEKSIQTKTYLFNSGQKAN